MAGCKEIVSCALSVEYTVLLPAHGGGRGGGAIAVAHAAMSVVVSTASAIECLVVTGVPPNESRLSCAAKEKD